MLTHEALKELAKGIWNRGESRIIGQGCIIPDWDKKNSNEVHNQLIEAYGATHFDRHWDIRGKSVLLNLYCAECYGAVGVTKDMLVFTGIIDIIEED